MSTRVSMSLTDAAESPQARSTTATFTVDFDEQSPCGLDAFQGTVHAAIAACCEAMCDEFKATTAHEQSPLV